MSESHSAESPHVIAVAREAERNKAPQQIKVGKTSLLLFPATGTIQSLEKYEDTPSRKRGLAELYEAKSFIAYVNSHKAEDRTHIFGKATEQGAGFTALLDHHKAKSDEAGNGEHSATLRLETTPEWRRWIANDRKLLTQEAFAEFIEENQTDIIQPDAATILEMAQMLIAKKTVNFKSGRNLRDGSIQLEYTETIEQAGGGTVNRRDDAMKLPDGFTLGLVPFVGINGIEIKARLRFRIGNDSKLAFQYLLDRPYDVIEQAFEAARKDIEDGTKLPVMLGSANITHPTY